MAFKLHALLSAMNETALTEAPKAASNEPQFESKTGVVASKSLTKSGLFQ